MNELHPIEAAWRRFRSGVGGEWLKRSLSARQSYLDSIGLKSFPREVVLPSEVFYKISGLEQRAASGDERVKELLKTRMSSDDAFSVWAAYRASKTIYEVDPFLAECLGQTSWPEGTPIGALRLPSLCPVLVLSFEGESIVLAAHYNLLTGEESSGALELRLTMLRGDSWLPVCILDMSGGTLSECLARAGKRAADQGDTRSWTDLWSDNRSGLALNVLLYLAGEPDIVRIVHPGKRPTVKPELARKEPERFRDLREPTVNQVGSSFTRAIERWEIEHRNDPDLATGRTVRPHMRRAHSHLYWTGKGREIPRVRFLLPISVTGGKLIEEPERPIETKVR
jgi:hypothetical protein